MPDDQLEASALELAAMIARHDLNALRIEMAALGRNRQLGPAETMALTELLWQRGAASLKT